ncbi:MAG: hypothetical protein V1668_00885 [Patescibacteria group bacterium]
MNHDRKIFFVVASGGHDTDRHYHDTIQNKRTLTEAVRFLSAKDVEQLKQYTHDRPYVAWGAVPGDRNTSTWESMQPGDYVMIYKSGKIILAAEVAMKVRNPLFAQYFWKSDREGKTWELMYFLINEQEVNVPIAQLNKYLTYGEGYFPRGFMAVDQEKTNKLLLLYGDLISLLQRIESGQKPEEIDFEKKKVFEHVVEEQVERAPTEHDEMQWRLIRLGNKCHFDVWVPRADQNKEFQGQRFKDLVIPEFHEALDIPSYIKNIDTVWKLGLSIKSAFEIENTTQIFSGILRLSDLRALAPNSNYPLFIVADRSKKTRVFDQLQRPTFSNEYLHLDRVVKFLGYDKVRELDESLKNGNVGFDIEWLTEKAEKAQ